MCLCGYCYKGYLKDGEVPVPKPDRRYRESVSACMESREFATRVSENILLGTKLKIPSVPNFIIAKIDPANPGKLKGISYIRGEKTYEYFQKEIDKALADLN